MPHAGPGALRYKVFGCLPKKLPPKYKDFLFLVEKLKLRDVTNSSENIAHEWLIWVQPGSSDSKVHPLSMRT